MLKRYLIRGGLALVVIALAGSGAWVSRLPAEIPVAEAPLVPRPEAQAMLAALQPARRERPLVAIIGINDATETTDYLMPTGMLRRADVADVMTLATGPGTVQLYPALEVEPDATVAQFDVAHPQGADYVIVPAMSRDDDPTVLAWLKSQSAKGAKIIGICAGAKVVGAAGLLDGKRATTHWYYVPELIERIPNVQYVPNRRMVSDDSVVTTTGITASMPMMLTLIEAIAGRTKAEAVARDVGLGHWDARHASDAFRISRPFATTVLANRIAFWNQETLGIRLQPGMDEVSLALVADAWSKTYRSSVVTLAAAAEPIETRSGMKVVPDRSDAGWPAVPRVSTYPDRRPADALDHALDAISARYGNRTSMVVAMQLEYPRFETAR